MEDCILDYYEPDLHYHLGNLAPGCEICDCITKLRQGLLELNLWTAQSIEEDILPSLSEAELYDYLAVVEERKEWHTNAYER